MPPTEPTAEHWQLLADLAAEVRRRLAQHHADSKAAEAARRVNGASYQRLVEADQLYRELSTALVDGAGYSDKHPLDPAIDAARTFLVALADPTGT